MEWALVEPTVKGVNKSVEWVQTGGCKSFGLVCEDTTSFRKLSALVDGERDLVVEVGSCHGLCTQVLARQAGAEHVLAIDISADCVKETSSRVPGAQVMLVNVLTEWKRFCELVREMREKFGPNRNRLNIFVDINGNREIESFAALLPKIEAEIKPNLLVVKGQNLYAVAQKTGLSREGWTAISKLAFEGMQKRRAEVSHTTRVVHALRAPKRKSAEGVLICRFFNYDDKNGCKKGERCPYDHESCNICLSVGHRALDCTTVGDLVEAFWQKQKTSPIEGGETKRPKVDTDDELRHGDDAPREQTTDRGGANTI